MIEPWLMELAPGEYQWCGCGRAPSAFCDGTGLYACKAVPFTVRPRKTVQTVWLCRCRRTRTPPFCDGSHNRPPKPATLPD